MKPSEDIYWALQQFTFAAKVFSCCKDGSIDFNLLKPPKTVSLPDDVTFTIPEWDVLDQKQLIVGSENMLMTSIGACAIAVDEALSKVHGKSSFKNWRKKPTALNSLRELIFLIRSAYAHKMPDVHWHIDANRRKAIYTVATPDGDVVFDANDKHGKKLNLSDFGGLGNLFKLVHYASDLAREHEKGTT